eukprot:TRINITY_DN1230_c0_g1_i1.p1 TRINITY_DN1230_c0_g1~~TRINITY_DN1230_c0_g1_i1.p1  ORF type:complete len:505 (-),score=99.61 TRINITY_DN1230_c0_g1_i1:3-1349(-)
MRDHGPEEMRIRRKVIEQIRSVFLRAGAIELETPALELKEVLLGSYGEDQKLIYDVQDQGGELLALRYDLTVPFARYTAANRLPAIKRFQIAPVWRRDNPSMTRGRLREFYQCDFDIAGTYDTMIPEAECVSIMCDILDPLLDDIAYTVKVNHRKLLDGILGHSGVPENLFSPIASAIDKLDKSPWKEVREEMLQKGISAEVADKLGEYAVINSFDRKQSPTELVDYLLTTSLASNPSAAEGLKEMKSLFRYVAAYGRLDKLSFDLSLARGLSYYSGFVVETVAHGTVIEDGKAVGVGSICGGGRYDSLVDAFGSRKLPAVGFSVGIERIFAIIQGRSKKVITDTQALVVSVEDVFEQRIRLCCALRKAGIVTEIVLDFNPNLKKQLKYAQSNGIPFVVFVGRKGLVVDVPLGDESVVIKDMSKSTQVVVNESDVADKIKSLLATKPE